MIELTSWSSTESGRLGAWRDRQLVRLRPQFLEALALGEAPAGKAGALRVLAADVDMDSADLERARAVEREDPALAAFHLRVDRHPGGDAEGNEQGEEPRAASHWPRFWRQRRGNPSGMSVTGQPMPQKPLTYADAGVSIAAGNALVKAIGPLARSTARPGADAELGGFGGLFDLKAAGYRDPLLVAANDGVGTKLKLAIELGRHDGVGIDLVAMCANDLIVQGAEPLFFLDYFASGKLDTRGCDERRRLDRRRVPAGGLRADRRRDGGDARHVCARRLRPRRLLRRRGRARRIARRQPDRARRRDRRHRQLGRAQQRLLAGPADHRRAGNGTLAPTASAKRCSSRRGSTSAPLLPLVRDGLVHGLAHITGGGLLENVPRVLPDDCRAEIDAGSWDLPPLFARLQQGGNVAAEEMARTFNCGIGMVAIVAAQDADAVIARLGESGEAASVIGRVEAGARGCTVRGPAGSWGSAQEWSASHDG